MTHKIGVIGAGSWGTALAISLARKGHKVSLWDLDKTLVEELDADRENKRYLSGAKFPENLNMVKEVEEAVRDAVITVFAAPAQHFRSALTGALPFMNKDTVIVDVAKGIEQKTHFTMSQIAEELAANYKYVVLSGPSHAEEVGFAMPTLVTVASRDADAAAFIQEAFNSDRFRVYTNSDVLGVELGGALKNIIALGAGISDGMGFGDNAKAALMTRGMTEISRLGTEMGANYETFFGLSGMGDLIVTCTSMHSRNRRCGIMIGEGMDPKEATEKVGMVVEGMFTTEAAYELAKEHEVKMPITESIYKLINGQTEAQSAFEELMQRELRDESQGLCK